MEFTDARKKEIEKMIVDSAIDALAAGAIKEADLQIIAQFVLTRIDEIKTEPQLVAFLTELSSKWKFFQPIERFLEAEMNEEEEKRSVDTAESLIKKGDLTEALQVLKAAEKGAAQ